MPLSNKMVKGQSGEYPDDTISSRLQYYNIELISCQVMVSGPGDSQDGFFRFRKT